MDAELDRLTMNLWRQPKTAEITLDHKQAAALMAATGGTIIACGYLWRLKSKSLGLGLHCFWCEEAK